MATCNADVPAAAVPAGGSTKHEPAGGQAHDSAPFQPNAADKSAIQSPAKDSVKEVSAVVPEEEPVIAKKQAKIKGTAKSGETNQAVKLPKTQNAYTLFMKDKKAAIKGELLLCLYQSVAFAGNDGAACDQASSNPWRSSACLQ